MKPIRLIDNTLYTTRGKEENPFSLPLAILSGQGSAEVKFLKTLSSSTIEQLNSDKSEEEGILVWPHSFKECKDNFAKMMVVECILDKDYKNIETLKTNNLVGVVGKGKLQVEIGTRFCNNLHL